MFREVQVRRAPDAATAVRECASLAPVLATVLLPGDTVPAGALAQVGQFCADNADADIIYADEESVDGTGQFFAPELKPDWSPIFQETAGYLGRAVYFRTDGNRLTAEYLESAISSVASGRLLTIPSGLQVRHLRRVALTKKAIVPELQFVSRRAGETTLEGPVTHCDAYQASIVIPTRDKVDLLSDCVTSLARTRNARFELIVVDNGSTGADTARYFEGLRTMSDVRVISRPGPFNFAWLCNEGASHARSPALVFLNNDTVVLEQLWLCKLLRWARRSDVGAVGARLVYPSLTIQHAGIVLGLKGASGHLDVGASLDEPGYLGRLRNAHEVTAVTGACLVVEKKKFDAVRGFDSKRYPVEFNDIDLCLRLTQSGWRTVLDPEAVLLHRESASRGRFKGTEGAYGLEHENFIEDWGARLLDDAYLHPAFSLQASRQVLF
jgi:O-antigen biosynthesis protein